MASLEPKTGNEAPALDQHSKGEGAEGLLSSSSSFTATDWSSSVEPPRLPAFKLKLHPSSTALPSPLRRSSLSRSPPTSNPSHPAPPRNPSSPYSPLGHQLAQLYGFNRPQVPSNDAASRAPTAILRKPVPDTIAVPDQLPTLQPPEAATASIAARGSESKPPGSIAAQETPPPPTQDIKVADVMDRPDWPLLTLSADEGPHVVAAGLFPPVSTLLSGGSSSAAASAAAAAVDSLHRRSTVKSVHFNVESPTCSLNLVCYRSGSEGCTKGQIECVLRERFESNESFQAARQARAHLIADDAQFFLEMRRVFEQEMCGFLRRHLSLKTLRAFRILAYTPTTRPTVVPLDGFVLQEMMYAYRNPDALSKDGTDWIQWVFRLRQLRQRHALEFVEGWNSRRIAIAGSIPWLASCLVGIIWSSTGGDPQTSFTVASFILTSSSIILALLAIISSIESSGTTIV